AVIPAFVGESHFNQKNYSLTMSWTPERRELDYLRYIGASDETAKEVKIFNLADFIADRFREVSHNYYMANRKLAVSRAWWGTALSILGTLAYYGAFVFILLQAIGGAITVGTLTFLAGSFDRMRSMLQGIMSRFSRIAEEALYLRDLFDFFELKPLIQANSNGLQIPQPIRLGFTFENVSFKYPNNEKWAIRNLSFHLQAGEKLALVGENGAGKTTLVKLLARLYEPTEGRILLDGKDIRDYRIEDLRNAIGIIFQDYIRFQMKASENIAIGSIEQRQERPIIENAARKSLADTVVETLPKGYDQILGKRFANGIELSGGQWQKVALARAYMRDAQLLILDEPTSALDARAEHEVFLRFSELIEGKTAVLISHRFSTVRMADRILFLENGELREIGSHEELVEKGGMYAELFRLQAKGYL
ncbi:MAG: ABC transporter ATP-binding protein, partial [Bacteroidota bacterium]